MKKTQDGHDSDILIIKMIKQELPGSLELLPTH